MPKKKLRAVMSKYPELLQALEYVKQEKPSVYQVQRFLAKPGGTEEGAWSAFDVSEYLSEISDLGYKLQSTHYLGENQAGYNMIYILVPAEQDEVRVVVEQEVEES